MYFTNSFSQSNLMEPLGLTKNDKINECLKYLFSLHANCKIINSILFHNFSFSHNSTMLSHGIWIDVLLLTVKVINEIHIKMINII